MSARPPRVLLIDDELSQLKEIGDALYGHGWHVQLLQHPTLAVATARTFQPDLVVIDLAMPVLDGREVVRALKAFDDTAKLPLVILTESTVLKDDMRLLQSGAIDLWRKPFDKQYLSRLTEALHNARARDSMPPNQRSRLALIDLARREELHGTVCLNPGTPFEGRAIFLHGQLHLARMGPFSGEAALDEMLNLDDTVWRFDAGVTAEPAAATAATEADAGGYQARLLLVEDQPDLLMMGAKQLERAGFKVDTAAQGQLGYEQAKVNDYDVIVADLNMPVLDGWGMLRLLRSAPRTREVPVMFLSAHDDYRETLKAAQSGAHDYLPKTGRSDELIRRARVLCAPRQATFAMLKKRDEVGSIELTAVGPIWLLRTLGELEATARLEAVDDLQKWTFEIEKGRLTSASAKVEDQSYSGARAVASYLGVKGGLGFVRPTAPTGQNLSGAPWVLDELERACRRSAEADLRLLDSTISTANEFVTDPRLYALFLRVASDRDVRLARAVCEEQIPPAQLSEKLQLSPEEVRESLRELVRRSVLTPKDDGGPRA
jgi:DNA-binding response OmpR family regulator